VILLLFGKGSNGSCGYLLIFLLLNCVVEYLHAPSCIDGCFELLVHNSEGESQSGLSVNNLL
jgi:hypothetical protein